jgi:hypothetical protein
MKLSQKYDPAVPDYFVILNATLRPLRVAFNGLTTGAIVQNIETCVVQLSGNVPPTPSACDAPLGFWSADCFC